MLKHFENGLMMLTTKENCTVYSKRSLYVYKKNKKNTADKCIKISTTYPDSHTVSTQASFSTSPTLKAFCGRIRRGSPSLLFLLSRIRIRSDTERLRFQVHDDSVGI